MIILYVIFVFALMAVAAVAGGVVVVWLAFLQSPVLGSFVAAAAAAALVWCVRQCVEIWRMAYGQRERVMRHADAPAATGETAA